MKELSIEEKAKRYDESLERAKKLKETCDSTAVVGWCEYIFNELAESEDERIRKELIEHCKNQAKPYIDTGNECPKIQSWIAWLEKQGEQNLVNETDEEIVEAVKNTSILDMVEPKFKAGQWIIDTQDGGILHINKVHEYAYEVTNLKSGVYQISRCSIETSYKPWTIQDAKDGDVLFSPSHNLLWLHKDEEQCHACINLNYNDSLSIETDFVTPSDVSPAIKEQRDLLFQKIKEAGYMWDAEKKELKEISQEYPLTPDECIKPAWGEEDEEMFKRALKYLQQSYYSEESVVSWLKTLKDRVQPQQEWSEEDKGNLLDVKCIIDEIWHCQYIRGELDHSCEELETLWHWLDDIWQRLEYPQDTWKPTWSEEDISKLNKIATTIYEAGEVQNWWRQNRLIDKETANELNDWLKSLKPQNNWKPSEEQLKKLHYAMQNFGGETFKVLNSLYEQLKKF